MIKYLTSIIFSIAFTVNILSQNKTITTIYESNKKDSTTKINEPQIYILRKITENSDFDYSKLDSIDRQIKDTLNIKNIMPIFEPISGKYKYYQFLSTFEGESYIVDEEVDKKEYEKEFHEIIIIKTDNDNIIIDAYQYTLEWAEPPLQFDLFRSSCKNVYLKNNMDIKQLKFIRTKGWSNDNKELQEIGIIKLN
jgi:hypothetical protein